MNHTEQLKEQIKQLVLNEAVMMALRDALPALPQTKSTDKKWLSPAKMEAWGKWDRLPDVAIEGAGIGIGLCLQWLGVPESEMAGVMTRFLNEQGAEGGLPMELLKRHQDELKTTWLHGDEAFHFVKLADEEEGQLAGEAWRFFTGIRMVPPWFEPRVMSESTHFVHGSTLDGSEPMAGLAQGFGLADAKGELVHDDPLFPKQVHLVARVEHGDLPLSCGYRYPIKNRFLTRSTEQQRFDAFSGANALPVRSSTVVVSLPKRLFSHVDSAEGLLFATPIPMLPQVYVQKVADKAKRGVLGKHHGLYSTWAKPADICGRVFDPADIWKQSTSGSAGEKPSFIEKAAEELFVNDRVVFAASFGFPNPLAYQSVMWRLPEALA